MARRLLNRIARLTSEDVVTIIEGSIMAMILLVLLTCLALVIRLVACGRGA